MFDTSRNPVILALVSLATLVVIVGVFVAVSQNSTEEVGESSGSEEKVAENEPAALSSPGVASAAARIFVTEQGFEAAEVRVKAGGIVTFTNSGENDHEIASTPHPTHTDYPALNLGVIKPFASKTLLFPQAGTYKFHDHLNPQFSGTVIVE